MDLDRRRESSLSLRLCVTYEIRTSSRMEAILWDKRFSWSVLESSIMVVITAKMKERGGKVRLS